MLVSIYKLIRVNTFLKGNISTMLKQIDLEQDIVGLIKIENSLFNFKEVLQNTTTNSENPIRPATKLFIEKRICLLYHLS